VMPSMYVSMLVPLNSAAAALSHHDITSSVDKSRDIYARTAAAAGLFNQSSPLAIILSRLVRTGPQLSSVYH